MESGNPEQNRDILLKRVPVSYRYYAVLGGVEIGIGALDWGS
jgi:hypothetical protein